MTVFVRKFEKAKWMQADIMSGVSPSADAITGCTRTFSNTLSVWLVPESENVDEAVIALASGFQSLDSIDILEIPEDALKEKGFNLIQTQGQTPYDRFQDYHHDIADLDYESLGLFASVVVEALKDNRSRRFTKGQLKRLLQGAIDDGRLKRESLHPGVLKRL